MPQISKGFWDTNWSPNLGQTTRSYNNQQKKRTCTVVDFVVSADHRIKLKESEKGIEKTVENEGDNYTNRD